MVQGLESSRLLILMMFGALCAPTGLFLLFRPPKTEGETRLELLGMKFNAASGGVIVFLIGAAFLAAPIFVPERAAPGGAESAAAVVGGAPKSPYAPIASVAPDGLPVRKRAEGREVERNDSFDAANRLEVGSRCKALRTGTLMIGSSFPSRRTNQACACESGRTKAAVS